MRSIQRRCEKIAEKNPNKNSYLCFAEAIKGQNFSQQTVHRWFEKLVEKDDFDKSEKKGILAFLDNYNIAEDNKKAG